MNEKERMRAIAERIEEEHAKTIAREKEKGTRQNIEKHIAAEFAAHLEREDALIDARDPSGRERRLHERNKISRLLAAAIWIALIAYGPEACSRLLKSAAEETEKSQDERPSVERGT